ncbi:glycosyltransferase family 39 protein [Streptomyces sp. NBC_01343]|uniref:glycosyltransferase family 39 protein n=1 Tax=Streptomyces sp. NBC_01343 TaxID=2903832 RepID=UPI002E1503A2|nr:glycosyltransferase family 39 protein [Streptomyces sp. NBC_01343]
MTSDISADRSSRYRTVVWPAPVVWTLGLGLWGLSRQDSVWRDEAATWQVAGRSTGEIVDMLGNVDAVHGLYYLLMHGLFELFGASTTTLRLPSVLAVAAAAACVAVIGRRLAGSWAGLGGGLALGLLPAVQFYLQEGRPYALVAAGAALSTLLLVSLLSEVSGASGVSGAGRSGRTGRRARPRWTAYAATVLVCALLNWLSLLVLPAHAATLWWVRAGRGTWLRWAAYGACAVAGALPLVLFSRSQSDQVSWIPPLTWHMMIGPAILLAVGGVCALADRPRAGRLSAAAVGLPLLAVPQLGLIGISLVQPLFLDRYVLFSMVGLALLIGAGLGAAVRAARPLFPRGAGLIVPGAIGISVLALLPVELGKRAPASRVDDVMAVAGEVARLGRPGDAVLFVPAARRDTALVSPKAFAGLADVALERGPVASATLKGEEADPARIRQALLGQSRVLLVTDAAKVAKPSGAARDAAKAAVLKERFKVVEDRQVRGRRVTVYERR